MIPTKKTRFFYSKKTQTKYNNNRRKEDEARKAQKGSKPLFKWTPNPNPTLPGGKTHPDMKSTYRDNIIFVR